MIIVVINSNYVPEERCEEIVDKFPHYKQDLLDQIERKQANDEQVKRMERQFGIDLNLKNKELMEDVSVAQFTLRKQKGDWKMLKDSEKSTIFIIKMRKLKKREIGKICRNSTRQRKWRKCRN